MSARKCVFIALVCLVASSKVFAQSTSDSLVVRVSSPDTLVHLPAKYILQNSEHVICDSVLLKRGVDYRIDYTAGTIRLDTGSVFFRARKDSVYTLSISYRNFPFDLPTEYTRHITIVKYDTSTKQKITMIEKAAPFNNLL